YEAARRTHRADQSSGRRRCLHPLLSRSSHITPLVLRFFSSSVAAWAVRSLAQRCAAGACPFQRRLIAVGTTREGSKKKPRTRRGFFIPLPQLIAEDWRCGL